GVSVDILRGFVDIRRRFGDCRRFGLRSYRLGCFRRCLGLGGFRHEGPGFLAARHPLARPGGRRFRGPGPRRGPITSIRLLIFHSCPSFFAVTTQRFPLSTVFPSGVLFEILVATRTSALRSSYHFCTPASTTVPCVGSARATCTRIPLIFSLNIFAKSPVACAWIRSP